MPKAKARAVPALRSRIEILIDKQIAKAKSKGKFSLSHANLDFEATKSIVSFLKSKAYVWLTHLGLIDNNIGDEGAIFIASALKSGAWPHIASLYLDSNHIGLVGTKAIISAIGSGACQHLKSLSLVGNNVGSEGARAIISILKSGLCPELTNIPLRYVNIDHSLISKVQREITFMILKQKIEQSASSGILDLSESIWGREAIKTVAAAIESDTLWNLSALNLAGHNLGYKGIKPLFIAFKAKKCLKLKYLNLEHNGIGAGGIEDFFAILKTGALPMLILRELKLAGNQAKSLSLEMIGAFILQQQSHPLFTIDYVNSSDEEGNTPLHNAAKKGDKSMTALLLDKKADVNARNHKDDTPISIAAVCGHAGVAEVLLKANANTDLYNQEGYTPIMIAATNGDIDMITMLIDRRPTEGYDYLYIAAINGFTDLVKLLIAKNIDLNATDNCNSVLDIAIECATLGSHQDTVSFLAGFLRNEDQYDNQCENQPVEHLGAWYEHLPASAVTGFVEG